MKSILLFIIAAMLCTGVNAKDNSKNKRPVMAKTQSTQIVTTRMDINNLNAMETNNGFSDYNTNSNLEGTEYPKGTGKTIVFQSGLLWGGYISGDPQVRVGGSAYRSGLQPGPIINGEAADPTDTKYSIYRVRPDVYPGGPAVDLSSDAALEGVSESALRAQYESDWTNWPAAGTANDLGAPFKDVNGDGIYEPGTDIPGVPGADQTIYYVANDLNSTLTTNLYGTQPIGLEVHTTYWAYNHGGALGNVYFKKYTLINKGYQHNQIDSMFVSYWDDPDLGSANDDLVGTDTTLNLIYTYNGEATDAVYSPYTPPAVGFSLLEGPIVNGNSTDTALFNGRILSGKKNLPMTSSYFFINNNANFTDPIPGEPAGATELYHFFNGEYGLTGAPFIDNKGNDTKFVFSGDPVAKTGWIDGVTLPPGDRRQGMASGPFNLAPGDTQEVVFAEIAGKGSDYLHSVYIIKEYQYNAAIAFNNLINGINTPSPLPPIMTLSNNNNSVQIQWDNKAESFNQSGYSFEGYNLYQLSSPIESKENATLIATFDKADGIKTIYGQVLNPQTNQVYSQVQQSGSDAGLQYSFTATYDYINQTHFIKGKTYYYAISAYTYNPKAGVNPTNTESILQPGKICYNSNLSGANYGDQVPVTHDAGSADGTVLVTIMDPAKLTGDKYKVSFHDEMFSLGSDGTWTDITALNKKLGKVTNLTGSNLACTGIWSELKDKVVLQYLVNVESIDYDYCNGVILRLPANIIVDSIYNPVSNYSGSSIPYIYNKEANTIFFGDSSRNGNGLFSGGEVITLKVDAPVLPVITNYTMYDDALDKSIVDVNGTCTLATIANQSLTQHQWNVTDLASGKIVLKNQTIYNNTDIYAPNYYFANNQIYGPGGSSGSLVANLDPAADPVFNGIKVDVNGNFTAPASIGSLVLNGQPLTINSSSSPFEITDFTIFGYDNATANSTLNVYSGSGTVSGTTDLNTLEQDYELKWTGVLGDTVINGDTVVITKSGGSLATLFGARNYSLAAHPLNPNPGSTNPFTIRIPFEVWNTTKKEQVNLLVFDRNYTGKNDPTKNGFSVWNTADRVYTWVVNTKYSTAVINPSSSVVADSATWSWVFFASKFNTGDDIKITYTNPIQIGKDSFTFTVPGAVESVKDIKTIKNFSLSQNYPNPFNPSTRIEYSLPKSEHVTLKLYDILGREVATLVNEYKQTGNYSIQFNAGKFASGVYIYRIQAGSFTQTKKLLLLK